MHVVGPNRGSFWKLTAPRSLRNKKRVFERQLLETRKHLSELTYGEMATKLTLGTHAAKALMEQAKRFDAMSVHLAKSADLATSQADEIAKWTSKLIDAVTKIRREAQDKAAACRERLQDNIRTLKTQADSAKRKILDTTELDSSRTIKANFRLIFGPPRDTEYKSRATK